MFWTTGSAWCYITLNLDQQEHLYQWNWISMVLYKTVSWSAGDDKPEVSDQNDVIKTGSCSADAIPEEHGQHDFI